MPEKKRNQKPDELDPLWYKDAIIYELHVRSFKDSTGDGAGDFRGLAGKLGYIRDLGVTAIWLLPFYPSPLRDDGYDISDYKNIHPAYGSLRDFKHFLREAHDRGLRVITELVLNHTSDQHQWFQKARRAPAGSPARNFYVWNDSPEKYREARIIFKDFETSNWSWDPVANAYYWHRFYSHQPDLNFDNPHVRQAMYGILDFWLDMGVDAFRLDAVPYLYEREGTNCENLAETYSEIKNLRRHIDEKYSGRMLLAEANQWPEDSVGYFGQGDCCHMAFHFPLMPRMFMATRMEDRYPLIDILDQTPPIPENCQWALFLRNHDELTLEMVTDEERDYMYRAYAVDPQMRINLGIRRRLAPLLSNDRRSIELMNAVLFSLPGTPVMYYGDEIGMGDNIYLGDRNGVRTPMQWNADRNAGFSTASSQRLYLPVNIEPGYHYEDRNVEVQQNSPTSLLWWTKHLIAMRKRYQAFGRGTLTFLYPENRKVLAYIRKYGEERILVVANLSRQAQYVELDLSGFRGMVPVELFGQTSFPPIGDLPYLLTLASHGFYWFVLETRRVVDAEAAVGAAPTEAPLLVIDGPWESLFEGRSCEALEELLPDFLRGRRWFSGKGRKIRSARIANAIPIPHENRMSFLALVRVEYIEGDPEQYALALSFAPSQRAADFTEAGGAGVVLRLKTQRTEGIVFEALRERSFMLALLDAIGKRRRFHGSNAEILGVPTRALRTLLAQSSTTLEPSLSRAEQSNSSVVYGDRMILKLFRRLDEGVNPDYELGNFLAERNFAHSPTMAGTLEYRENGSPMTMAILQKYVRNEGDAWSYTLDNISRYFQDVLARIHQAGGFRIPSLPVLQAMDEEVPAEAREMIGPYLESARLLGERTADLHLALASEIVDPDFRPEPFSTLYQRSVYQSMRSQAGRSLQLLRSRLRYLPEPLAAPARAVLAREAEIQGRFRSLLSVKIAAMRTRVHGDYHLGQVLWTGKDFVVIDFEGEPMRPISERRLKRSPL
ncbi:MAG TPA: maltose alpha-D-glucosyltransferase, partial [Terriglobales bacterium]|nr:maltose alpha-D-glucosyltransferase [Terriglobales bacterium]